MRRFKSAIRVAPVVLVVASTAAVIRSAGSPPGYAGAPIDGYTTCSSCHAGGSAPGGVDTPFYIKASEAEYSPGSPIEITVTIDEAEQPYYAPGFEVTAVRGDDHAGTFVIVDSDHTQFAPEDGGGVDDRYVTHLSPNSDTRDWTVVWEPDDAEEDVVFYAAGLSRYEGIVYRDSLVIPRASSVGRENAQSELPRLSALHQNHPNPFELRTVISFDIFEAGEITLRVYDLAGREVETLAEGWLPAGRYEPTFNAQGLPNGVYVYRLSGSGYEHARTMLVVR